MSFSALLSGTMANANIVSSGAGLINAWIDFDGNGVWDATEHILIDAPVVAGPNNLGFLVPAGVTPKMTFARVRLSSVRGLQPTGLAPDGEVEDYAVVIQTRVDQNPVLALSKTIGPAGVVSAGDPLMFTLSYTNLGPGVAANCLLTDTLPAGFLLGSVSSTPFHPYWTVGPKLFVDLGNLPPGQSGTVQINGQAGGYGPWTNYATLSSSNAPGVTASVPFAVVQPQDPNFPTNHPPFDFVPCICGPLVGNYVSNQVERWFVSCDGGSLDFKLTTVTVNTNDPQVTIADIYDGATLLSTVTVSYTAAEAALHGIGWETNQTITLGPFAPGKKLRVEVRVGGTPETQTHYWLKFCGARWLALKSESFHSLEDDNAAYRFIVNPGEPLVVDINTNGIVAPAGQMDYRLIDPSGTLHSSGSFPIAPTDEFVLPTPMPGLWTLQLKPSPGSGEHYLLNKKSGADQFIYMDWHTSQRGRKVVLITLDGAPAVGVPFAVDLLRRRETATGYTNDLMASAVVTNSYAEFGKLANGYYDVVVTPLVAGISNVPSQLDLLLCDLPATNRFNFHRTSNDELLDYGDAPAPYPTLLADDGARHKASNLRLGALWDAEKDGQPDALAHGDDVAGVSDEDGVSFSLLIPGNAASASIVSSSAGLINAWIDFGQNGVWDPAEQIIVDAPVIAGMNVLNFRVPPGLRPGVTFSRVRLSTLPGLTPKGLAPDGEVEDYRVSIAPPAPTAGGLTHESGRAAISFPTSPGVRYRLQYKDSITDTNWVDGPMIIGDGNNQTIHDHNPAEAGRFYRLRME